MVQHRIIIGSVPRLMRADNEEDEEQEQEDMGVEIVSTSQYVGVRTRKGKVLVWSALGDNTLILTRDCVIAGDVLMLSSCSSGFHFAMVKKEEVEEGDNKKGRNL